MADLILKEESYKIIGLCLEVHKQLGVGFKEIIYKDALEIEFKSHNIPFIREKQFKIEYKGASGLQLGIIANFGERSFTSKRVVF